MYVEFWNSNQWKLAVVMHANIFLVSSSSLIFILWKDWQKNNQTHCSKSPTRRYKWNICSARPQMVSQTSVLFTWSNLRLFQVFILAVCLFFPPVCDLKLPSGAGRTHQARGESCVSNHHVSWLLSLSGQNSCYGSHFPRPFVYWDGTDAL